eukprot:TRINITY_DN10920_c0_g1_i1.p1 TRINITY_DN10920_c0_g1~~TRINITY_DN10920_c0_g1_i1.p1  ORF type:complete len:458 (-),score=109.13 TRINITY_DN10920_c0_g1_i1:283-1656(-)
MGDFELPAGGVSWLKGLLVVRMGFPEDSSAAEGMLQQDFRGALAYALTKKYAAELQSVTVDGVMSTSLDSLPTNGGDPHDVRAQFTIYARLADDQRADELALNMKGSMQTSAFSGDFRQFFLENTRAGKLGYSVVVVNGLEQWTCRRAETAADAPQDCFPSGPSTTSGYIADGFLAANTTSATPTFGTMPASAAIGARPGGGAEGGMPLSTLAIIIGVAGFAGIILAFTLKSVFRSQQKRKSSTVVIDASARVSSSQKADSKAPRTSSSGSKASQQSPTGANTGTYVSKVAGKYQPRAAEEPIRRTSSTGSLPSQQRPTQSPVSSQAWARASSKDAGADRGGPAANSGKASPPAAASTSAGFSAFRTTSSGTASSFGQSASGKSPLRAAAQSEEFSSAEAQSVYRRLRASMDQPQAARKKIHKDLMREYHPDKNSEPYAKEVFQMINKARDWFLADD